MSHRSSAKTSNHKETDKRNLTWFNRLAVLDLDNWFSFGPGQPSNEDAEFWNTVTNTLQTFGSTTQNLGRVWQRYVEEASMRGVRWIGVTVKATEASGVTANHWEDDVQRLLSEPLIEALEKSLEKRGVLVSSGGHQDFRVICKPFLSSKEAEDALHIHSLESDRISVIASGMSDNTKIPSRLAAFLIDQELKSLQARQKQDAARIAELEAQRRQNTLIELAASIFGDSWHSTDEPTPETLTDKFESKVGEPLDAPNTMREISELVRVFRQHKSASAKYNGTDCVAEFYSKRNLLSFRTRGKKDRRTLSEPPVTWPPLTFHVGNS